MKQEQRILPHVTVYCAHVRINIGAVYVTQDLASASDQKMIAQRLVLATQQ